VNTPHKPDVVPDVPTSLAQPEHNDETKSVYESASNNEKSQSKVVSGEEEEVFGDDDSVNSQSGENEKTIFDNEEDIVFGGMVESTEKEIMDVDDLDSLDQPLERSLAVINKGLDRSAKTMAEADFPIYRVTKEISSGQ
ncbi:hypothetical protein A2U01_0050007, partial [Trifolium medium]|nr:hypothetical protein [Trifolium medium]